MNYLTLLPRGAAKKIHEESGEVVSYRQVLRILSGEFEDSHGIIDLAIKAADKWQKKKEKQNQKALLLQKSIRSTHNTK